MAIKSHGEGKRDPEGREVHTVYASPRSLTSICKRHLFLQVDCRVPKCLLRMVVQT